MSKIFEFQSLSHFPYFTQAAFVECDVLLHISHWVLGLGAEQKGESYTVDAGTEEMQCSPSIAAGAFYIRRFSLQ